MTMPGKNEVELPGNMHPVLAILAFLPMMTILMIALAFVVEEVPIALLLLLIVVSGCCVLLSWSALQMMLGGKLTFGDDGLTVHGLLSKTSYPWPVIEACKVMPATGTFGDDPLVEADDRVGVGLLIRGLDRQREHDLDADVVLCAGRKDKIQRLMQIANKVESAAKRGRAPAKRAPARALPAGTPRQPRAGARRQNAAPVDPVKAFRERAPAK